MSLKEGPVTIDHAITLVFILGACLAMGVKSLEVVYAIEEVSQQTAMRFMVFSQIMFVTSYGLLLKAISLFKRYSEE
ncbi:hypothetical protein DRO66_00550 [Candidatus Bathyarchaeota archaeon]|nr:MAG: hypothetical protein DRO66_00550 [Candidatus Bathyarchaeota archaeon]